MSDFDILFEELRKANINKAMTAEQAAKATHAAVHKAAERVGQDADRETLIRAPGEPRYFGDTQCWVVAWEAGPYQWGVSASLSDIFPHLVEPYYSFDLTFYPGEWPRA